MTIRTCSRQTEVKQLLAQGHWPHACPAELHAHLAGCRSCAGLLLVAQAFQQSRAAAAAEVRLPPSSAIWWRAQLRRRNAAVERVGKPILGAYVFAMALTLAVAAVVAVSQARQGLRWLEWGSAALHSETLSPAEWWSYAGTLFVLIAVFATVAMVGAVLVYLSAERL